MPSNSRQELAQTPMLRWSLRTREDPRWATLARFLNVNIFLNYAPAHRYHGSSRQGRVRARGKEVINQLSLSQRQTHEHRRAGALTEHTTSAYSSRSSSRRIGLGTSSCRTAAATGSDIQICACAAAIAIAPQIFATGYGEYES